MAESSGLAMIERRNVRAAMVVLGASAIVTLYGGVLEGLREDWMRMSLHLFTFTLLAFWCTTSLATAGLSKRLTQLEERFHIDRKQIPKGIRRITTALGLFMVLSMAVHMTLSIIAGFRGDWFRFGIHLTACAVTAIICVAVLTTVGLGTRLARLEKLLVGTSKTEDV